jgi:hypothetical protein
LCGSYGRRLRTHDFILHSKRTIAELETFIFHNGKPEAIASYNDDLVMSLAIGMYVRTTTLKFNSQDEEMTKELLQGLTFNLPLMSLVYGMQNHRNRKTMDV